MSISRGERMIAFAVSISAKPHASPLRAELLCDRRQPTAARARPALRVGENSGGADETLALPFSEIFAGSPILARFHSLLGDRRVMVRRRFLFDERNSTTGEFDLFSPVAM